MEIRQLQYFLHAVEEKSFVKAAQKAFVSQQALSKAIQNLEHELGITVFERGKKGLVLTQYGKILYNNAIRIINLADDTLQELAMAETSRKRSVILGTSFRLFELIDMKQVFGFQDEYPQWDLQTIEATDKNIENGLFLEKIDVACIGSKADMPYFQYSPIVNLKTKVAVNVDHPLAGRESVRLRDLKDQVFIFGNKDYNAMDLLIDACEIEGFVPQIGHQFMNSEYKRRLLLLNKGVFLCPDRPATMDEPSIRILPLEDDINIYSLYVITKKNRVLPEQARIFRDYLFEITAHLRAEGA